MRAPIFLLQRIAGYRPLLLVLLILNTPLTLLSCASPTKDLPPDAWAYQAYPGDLKDSAELANVYVRMRSSRDYRLPDNYHSSRTFKAHWSDAIYSIDGDEGGRYSLWNQICGGNDSALGYLKMWIEPGKKSVDAIIDLDGISERHINFSYDFKAGYEYKFSCVRGLESAKIYPPAEEYNKLLHSDLVLSDFPVECYVSRHPHDGDSLQDYSSDSVFRTSDIDTGIVNK